jgi:hypothetical protein
MAMQLVRKKNPTGGSIRWLRPEEEDAVKAYYSSRAAEYWRTGISRFGTSRKCGRKRPGLNVTAYVENTQPATAQT